MFERFTDQARQVVVFAIDEARTHGHNYVGTERLLVGLLRDTKSPAFGILEPISRLGSWPSSARLPA